MKKYAIVVAGGKGLRMGGEIPKQFIPVQGRPVLMRTLDVFHAYDESVELIVVLPVAQQGYWNELCREYDFRIPYHLADGGETRFHSVANGLAEVPDGETDALVAVHDAYVLLCLVKSLRHVMNLLSGNVLPYLLSKSWRHCVVWNPTGRRETV